jgi:hypothetical protein
MIRKKCEPAHTRAPPTSFLVQCGQAIPIVLARRRLSWIVLRATPSVRPISRALTPSWCSRNMHLASSRCISPQGPFSRTISNFPWDLFPDASPVATSRTVPPTTPSSSWVVSSSPFLAGTGVVVACAFAFAAGSGAVMILLPFLFRPPGWGSSRDRCHSQGISANRM